MVVVETNEDFTYFHRQAMCILNIEIKARCEDLSRIRTRLRSQDADFIGTDHQVDTYFNVRSGRLKLREGNIENCLIFYQRHDQKGPKESHVMLFPIQQSSPLKEILIRSLGVLALVDKKREIYFIDNVKIHLDEVDGLGKFVEIEAIDDEGTIGKEKLGQQCRHYMDLLGIGDSDLVELSYRELALSQ
jgi:adenylate cyclase class 2